MDRIRLAVCVHLQAARHQPLGRYRLDVRFIALLPPARPLAHPVQAVVTAFCRAVPLAVLHPPGWLGGGLTTGLVAGCVQCWLRGPSGGGMLLRGWGRSARSVRYRDGRGHSLLAADGHLPRALSHPRILGADLARQGRRETGGC